MPSTGRQLLVDTILSNMEKGREKQVRPTSASQAAPVQKAQPKPSLGLNDLGDAMRLIMQNPVEFAVPAVLGASLEQVFMGALNRQQRAKAAKSKPKKSQGEGPTILQDVMESNKEGFIGKLIEAFRFGGGD